MKNSRLGSNQSQQSVDNKNVAPRPTATPEMFYKKGETTEDEEQMDEEQIMSGLEVDEDDAESGASVTNIE